MEQGVYIAFDYGEKRVGLAHTDPLQLIASALDTLSPEQINDYLHQYQKEEKILGFIVGKPSQKDGTPAAVENNILSFINQLEEQFPKIPIFRQEERYTSKMAAQVLHISGGSKKSRQDKSKLDRISATILLQSFLDAQKNKFV